MQTEQWNIQPMVGDFLTTLIQKSTGEKKVHFYIYICVTFKTMPHSSFKQLNGPNLNRLLEKSLDLHKFLPTELKKFANCLRLLKEMMEACYGVVLEDHWEMKTDRFRMEYMNLGLEMTPKFHCKQKHN